MCISSGSVKSHDIILQYNCFLPSVFEVGNIAESSRMTPKGNTQTQVPAGKGEYMLRTDSTCTYPVVNDRWGATDVATLSLHFILFSASLTAWQNFNPVHSAMLFSQRFFCRPLLLPPCNVPCKIVLIRAQTTLTCVSLLWLRYHYRAQWLAWFCLWLHR